MAKQKFEKVIEKYYPGLNFLAISNEAYAPGVVLNHDDRIVDTLESLFPGGAWTTKTVDANTGTQKIEGSRSLELGATILGSVMIKSGVASRYEINFEFGQMKEVIFDNRKGAPLENELRNKFMQLKNSNRNRWNDVLHNYVVMSSLYVDTFTATFIRDGNVETNADVITRDVSIHANAEWKTDGKLKLTGNKTPFGTRGFIVKRFM